MGIKKEQLLLPDFILGHLLCVYLNLYKPEGGIYSISIEISNPFASILDSLQIKEFLDKKIEKDKNLYKITINQKQYKILRPFLKRYNSLYSKKELRGQQNYSRPEIYANELLQEINNVKYIERYGYNNLALLKHKEPFFCHSLMHLVFQEKIKIRKLLVDLKTVNVNLDNISPTKARALPLPKGVHWEASKEVFMLTFNDGKKLKFTSPKNPSAKYFKILIDNYGLKVKHNKVQQEIKNKTHDQIRNLVKTLNKKIRNAGLSKRITFETKYEGAYSLFIS